MTVYFTERKNWRYDFTRQGKRHTKSGFKTKREAEKAEQYHKNELESPTQIDMDFLKLLNLRLDEVKQRLSHGHYMDTLYHARRWANRWSGLSCSDISIELITDLRDERGQISNQTANKELRYLSSLFNWGIKEGYITQNPVTRIDLLRVKKEEIYVPSEEDIDRVISVASPEQRD